jgi:hypothetical protein
VLRLTDEQIKEQRKALKADVRAAQEQLMKAQERLSFFKELTQPTGEEKPPPQPLAKTTQIELMIQKPTVADASEKLLEERGALTTTELYKLLSDGGMIADTTTRNSLHMTLNKYKKQGKRFERNQDGQWILRK